MTGDTSVDAHHGGQAFRHKSVPNTISCAPMAEDEDSMDEEMKKADKEKPFYANSVKRLGAAEPMSRYGSYVRACAEINISRRLD